MEKDKIR